MNTPETNDPIDKLLREQNTHVSDDGFTKRVMGRLPRRRGLLPRMFLLAVAVAGSVLAVYWLPWKSLPPLDYTGIFSADSKILTAWLPFVVVIVALVSAARAALRWED